MWLPLESLQHVHVLLVLQSLKPDTTPKGVLQVLNRGNLPQPADKIIVNTTQYAVNFLHYKNTPLTRTPCVVHQHPQVLFCKIAFYPVSPLCVLLSWSPLKFRAVSHGILSTNPPNEFRSVLLKSRAVILPFLLFTYLNMAFLEKADVSFHVLHEFFLSGEKHTQYECLP